MEPERIQYMHMNNNNRHHNRHKYALRLAFACICFPNEHLVLLHSYYCDVELSVLFLRKTCEMEENVALKLFDCCICCFIHFDIKVFWRSEKRKRARERALFLSMCMCMSEFVWYQNEIQSTNN